MELYKFWRYWLLLVSIFITVFGFVMALFNTTIVFAFFNDQINPVFWSTSSVPSQAQAFQAWVYGAWGSTVFGWGVTMFFIALYPFTRRERWAWHCVFVSVVLWFILDTGISWWFGVMVNVMLNITILVLVLIPLIGTWQKMTN